MQCRTGCTWLQEAEGLMVRGGSRWGGGLSDLSYRKTDL